MSITAAQIRGARGVLNWGQSELAERTGVSATSIGSIENGATQPREATLQVIRKAFEEAGIEFLPGSGVRLRSEMIGIMEGADALDRLLDDIYKTLHESGGMVSIFGLEEHVDPKSAEYAKLQAHLTRLQEAGISERIILREGDTRFLAPVSYYKWVDPAYFSPYPFLLYGSKLAMVNWGPPVRILVIESPMYAMTFGKLFGFVWERAESPRVAKQHDEAEA